MHVFNVLFRRIMVFAIAIVLALGASFKASAVGVTVYVKVGGAGTQDGLSWGNAHATIQEGITTAGAGDFVWVAAGTYYPTAQLVAGAGNERTKAINLEKDVKVFGGFAGTESALNQRNPATNVTIISGDIGTPGDDSDNCYHVVIARSTTSGNLIDEDCQFDGFRITKGNANGSGGGAYTFNAGGGIIIQHCRPIIQNCVFLDNKCDVYGGGAFVEGTAAQDANGDPPAASAKFISCAFLGNHSEDVGGGCANRHDETTAINCVFSGNTADGTGGGLHNHPEGLGVGGRRIVATNCTFSQNTATDGGGIFNGITGGVTAIVSNCILWGNTATSTSDDQIDVGHTSTISYNVIESGSGIGTNTLTGDPEFGNAAGPDSTAGTLDDNLHLRCGSSAIDSGGSGIIPVDSYDVDDDGTTTGEATPDRDRAARINVSIDRGSYETHADPCQADVDNNGIVNVNDLLAVIGTWGTCPSPPASCIGDIGPGLCSTDGEVDVNDLLLVIGAWGYNCATDATDDVGSLESVQDCMDACSEVYTTYSAEWDACVERCVAALCEAGKINCD